MKKKFFRSLCLLMICLSFSSVMLSSCATGGTSNESSSNEDNPPMESTAHNVWSTYSTVKVTQNVKDESRIYYDVLDASVDIEMMKDETEGTQLIITAGQDIKSYDLELSDLSDGKGNMFSKDNIAVYHQKYMRAESDYDPGNLNLGVGDDIPDMLLPLDIAKQYGENTVKAGQNQGITIEAETTAATIPGTYTGTFVLDIDGVKQNIPVSITVWDIELVGKSEYQSSFLIYENQLIHGEYEASDEVAQRYNEFLLKYNANGFTVNKQKVTAAEVIEECENMVEDKNFNSLPIYGYTVTGSYSITSADAEGIITYILDTMKLSSEDKPYIEMLYLYPMAFDEIAPSNEAQWNNFLNKFALGGPWDQTLQKALERAKETEEYKAFDAEFQQRVDEAILNIPAIVPIKYYQDIMGELSATFCPTIEKFDSDLISKRLNEDAVETTNEELWTYTCIGPVYPYPTFHTTDYNLGSRVGGWISKQHNATGYLYYMVNMYEGNMDVDWKDVDPYDTINRLHTCPGDGYLLYPGRKYGSEYPFASTRLVAYRDSVDDYDMLTIYEQLLNEKAEKYGIEIDFNDYVNDLYDSLTEGSQYYIDDANLVAVRRELANRILALKSELGLMVSSTKGNMTIYSASQNLMINGEPRVGSATGDGYKFEVENTDGIAKGVNLSSNGIAFDFKMYAAREITFSSASTNSASQATVNGSYAEVTIKAEEKNTSGATERFKPYVEFEIANMSNALNIQFELSNSGEQWIEATLYLITSDGTQLEVNSFYVAGRENIYIRFDLDKRSFTDEVLATVKKIKLTFDNTLGDGTATLLPDRSFIIDNIFVELNK